MSETTHPQPLFDRRFPSTSAKLFGADQRRPGAGHPKVRDRGLLISRLPRSGPDATPQMSLFQRPVGSRGVNMKYMLLIYMSENAMGETEREQCYKDSAQLAQDLQANGQYLSRRSAAGDRDSGTTVKEKMKTESGKRNQGHRLPLCGSGDLPHQRLPTDPNRFYALRCWVKSAVDCSYTSAFDLAAPANRERSGR